MLGVTAYKQYQVLDALGISLWENRLVSPWVSPRPLFYARCLVLLSHPTQEQKIFEGMLSVLNLQTNEIAIAWPNESHHYQNHQKQTEAMLETITVWAPQSILVMGESLGQQLLPVIHVHLQVVAELTYHPDALKAMPENKPKAYQALLKLKQYLSM